MARGITMFTLPGFDGLSTVTKILILVGAFVGPERNAKEMVPVERKFDALSNLARTGDSRRCDEVIDAIRKRKTEASDTLKVYEKSRDQLRDGIVRDLKWLKDNVAADQNIRTV